MNIGESNTDGSQVWGYVEVRRGAHMFWSYYESPNRIEDPSNPWPIILWLQGGPGASGFGVGNFKQIGPVDTFRNDRESSWLKKADLLFVDSPVGTGYSYVEKNENTLYVKSDEEAANDLTKLLIDLVNKIQTLNQSPLFIVGESYGGKIAVKLGLSIIESDKLKLRLGGVVLGNSWISPEDFVFSWGPLLKHVSRLDDNGLEKSNTKAETVKESLENGRYYEATQRMWDFQKWIISESNSVDFYNFMLDDIEAKDDSLIKFMNDESFKKKLGIPKTVRRWGKYEGKVLYFMEAVYMKPVIDEVDKLLTKGIHVTIYSGQLDVMCSTIGTEAWVNKLKWEGIEEFKKMKRNPFYCDESDRRTRRTRGFTKSFKNLHFYWILGAGHSVPTDLPCVALKMIGEITKSTSDPKSMKRKR